MIVKNCIPSVGLGGNSNFELLSVDSAFACHLMVHFGLVSDLGFFWHAC